MKSKLKLKTCKSALKRIKKSKNILLFKPAFKAHLLRKKNAKRKRHLSLPSKISQSDFLNFCKLIPYI